MPVRGNNQTLLWLFVFLFAIFLALTFWKTTKITSQQSAAPTIHVTEISQNETDPNNVYSIQLTYPQVQGTTDTTPNKLVMDVIDQNVHDFKIEASEQITTSEPPPPNNLVVTSTVSRADEQFFSANLAVSTYIYHAAHPNTINSPINYSFKLKKSLETADLFKFGTDFAQLLSTISKEKLYEQYPDRSNSAFFIESGASAQATNFTKFNLSSDSLILIFDPYQVGPYVDGTISVTIPFTQLADNLNPELNLVPSSQVSE